MRIRNKFALIFLSLSLIPMFLIGVFSYRSSREALRKNLGLSFQKIAHESVSKVDQRLYDIYHNVQIWTTLAVMQEVVTGDLDGRISAFLLQLKREYQFFSALEVVNEKGSVVASSQPERVGADVTAQPFWASLIAGQNVIEDVHFDAVSQKWIVLFAFPVFAEFEEKTPVGAIFAAWDARELSSIISPEGEDVETGPQSQLLLRSDGLLIGAPALWQADVFKQNLIEAGAQAARFASEKKKGYLVERLPSQGSVLIGFYPSQGHADFKGLGWSALVVQSTESAFASVMQLQGVLFAALGLTALLMVVVAFFTSSQLARPLLQVVRVTDRVAQGDLKSRVEFQSNDEIGVLARSFNRMLDDLDKTTVSRDSLVKEIEERKIVENKLRQSEKMGAVGQLAGGIAHDLNNGLTPVMGYLDLLLLDVEKEGPLHGMLMEAKSSAQRCIDVVQKLMNFSRPSTQVRSELPVEKLLSELKKILRPVFPATITIDVDYPADVGSIYGNETDLMTVLMNLAINARDAMKAGGKFTAKASNVGDKIFLALSDTGMGMSPQIVSRIFEPFFTTKAKGHGTGLGLAMVYSIIKDHRGTIEVLSQEGKGTSFYIYLPRYRQQWGQPVLRAVSQKESKMADLPKGHGTVLFVDDEETLRSMGKTFLERLGYTVYLAQDGEEAIKIYQQNHSKIAAILLDMTMPKLSGMETMKRLLQINPYAKIAVASGYTAEGSTEDLLAAGAKTFIQKPYTIGPLAQTLQQLMAP